MASTLSPQRPRAGLARTAAGDVVPLAAERARGRRSLEDPFVGWTASIAVALLAFFLRVWKLGTPHAFSFDETYYAKDAWSLANFGYVRDYTDDADEWILDGRTMGYFEDTPSMVVHPEVGKWLIAAGEKAFGMDPFGWRIEACVIGSLLILLMVRFVRRITGSTLLGVIGGLLLALDGLQLVLSRLALLDIFVAFFILLGTHLLVMDRDWFRRRLADRVPDGVASGWGPRVWWRPYLLLAGVAWGLGVGTKWIALYPLAVFGLMVWLWSAGARRMFGVRLAALKSALIDGVPAALVLIGTAFVVYVATWSGWLVHVQEYEEHLGNSTYTRYNDGDPWPAKDAPDASGLGEVTQSLSSLWHYHRDVYLFHTQGLDDSEHTYQSKPSGWLLLNRPVGVDAQLKIKPGQQGCEAPEGSDCLRQVLLLGNPVIWWGSIIALLGSLWFWIAGRDWRFGVAVLGTASSWLPWMLNDDRPIFIFYAITMLPFMVLAITLVIGKLLGPDAEPTPRRTAGVIVAGAYFVLALVAFAFFWPIWTDQLLTHSEWIRRMWFQKWI